MMKYNLPVHLLRNVYLNDSTTDSINCYRIAEWTFFYLTPDEIKLLFEEDLFYEYINENVNYLGDLTEKTAKETCKCYYNGKSGTELHIKNVTHDTPCGDYWFK